MTGLDGIHSLEKVLGSLGVQDAQRTAQKPQTAQAGITQMDQSSVSSAGTLASGDSDVRLEKVQALQKAIADGSYSVSSNAVAGKLLDTLLTAR